jgi:hypothetical protein
LDDPPTSEGLTEPVGSGLHLANESGYFTMQLLLGSLPRLIQLFHETRFPFHPLISDPLSLRSLACDLGAVRPGTMIASNRSGLEKRQPLVLRLVDHLAL